MVSRKNYITIVMLFLILFFLFQISGVMKEQLNEWQKNSYAETTGTSLLKKDCFQMDMQQAEIFWIGQEEAIEQVVSAFCIYSKSNLNMFDTVEEAAKNVQMASLMLIDGSCVTSEETVKQLQAFVESGIDLIFVRLPEYEVIAQSSSLRELLGIKKAYSPQIDLSGMHLFEGFILGGEALYEVQNEDEAIEKQDMAIPIPWYITGSGVKTYMVGTLSEDSWQSMEADGTLEAYMRQNISEENAKTSLLPAILWRKGFADAAVFCVNGDFLSEFSGMGILYSFLYENSSYALYPIVNAQNIVLNGYPVFSQENQEIIDNYYSQSLANVYQDLVWPSLSSITKRTNGKLTCLMTPSLDNTYTGVLQGEPLSFYLQLFGEEKAEGALFMPSDSNGSIAEKLEKDAVFWQKYAQDFSFVSAGFESKQNLTQEDIAALPESIRTVFISHTEEKEPPIGYLSDTQTQQYATEDGITHSFMDDFQLHCMQTALGYSTVVLDMEPILYPKEDSDSWHIISRKISANLMTYWKPFSAFGKTTLAESDDRIRRFLALDYQAEREENKIWLSIDNFDTEAYFILRLHDEEVCQISGGTVTKIEEDAFLVHAEEPKVSICVEQK